MDKDHIELVQLVLAHIKGTLNEADAALLKARAAHDPFVRELLREYQDDLMTAEKLDALDAIPQAADWEEVLSKRRARRRKIIKRMWMGMAAAVLLMVGMAWLMMWPTINGTTVPDTQYGHKNDVLPGGNKAILTLSDGKQVVLNDRESGQLNDASSVVDLQAGRLVYHGGASQTQGAAKHQIVVPIGGTYQLVLSDGTKVWVNADSKLIFPAGFATHERRVTIAGEAYFEIAKDAARPFIVEVDKLQITALGTAFNVNSHARTGQVKTILTEGGIKVSNGRREQLLQPGFALVSQADDMRVEAADLEEALAWKDGYFYFNHKNMEEILDEVARWYGVEVVSTVAWGSKKYIGDIKRSSTLGGVCALLADLSGKQFSIEGKKLIVN